VTGVIAQASFNRGNRCTAAKDEKRVPSIIDFDGVSPVM